MINTQKSLKLLTFSLISTLFLFGGCGLREAKKQQKIREAEEAAKRTAELNHKWSTDFQSESARKAKNDLSDRVRYARGLEGSFQGHYTSDSSAPPAQLARLRVNFSATNLPAPFENERPLDAAELRSHMEAISLVAEVYEESTSNPEIRYLCRQAGVKPDFSRGEISVTCQNALNSPTREYLFTLDDRRLDNTLDRYEDNPTNRAGLTSVGLIEGRIQRVQVMNVRVASPYGKVFRGTLERLESQESE